MNHEGRTGVSKDTIFAVIYFTVYLAYLFHHQETEFEHYISLVALPLIGLWFFGGRPRLRELFASIGLRRSTWRKGLGMAVGLGLVLQILPLMGAPNRERLADVLMGPYGWLFALVSLPFLLVTVALTEELFFRGILQTRLADATRSEWAGIGLTTLAFIVYHIPYAYLNPHWPSAGDFGAAVGLSVVNAGLGGVILGWVFLRSGRNLLAPLIVHAMIDWLPGTILISQIKFG